MEVGRRGEGRRKKEEREEKGVVSGVGKRKLEEEEEARKGEG